VKGPADKFVGWGLAGGFGIKQMPYASVRYGGVLSLKQVLIAVTFFVRPINANLVTRVIVLAPMDPPFEMRCSTADSIRALSLGNGRVVPDLPGATSCTDESPLTLTTDLPLPAGPHAFMVMANVPDKPPVENYFDILLLDEMGETVDAAYKVSGVRYAKLPIRNPIFTWWGPGENGQAKAKHHTEVTMGIELTEAYSPRSNFTIRAILVTFPTNFSQDIPRAHEVENLNENFSAASGEFWVDLKVNTQLKIVLNEFDPWLEAGVYKWRFPVVVPPDYGFPHWSENLWQITICSAVLCSSPDDQYTLVSFVVDGFGIGTDNPNSDGAASYVQRASVLFFFIALVAELLA